MASRSPDRPAVQTGYVIKLSTNYSGQFGIENI